MEDGKNNPIIDGPEPSRWSVFLGAARAALASLRARAAAPPAAKPRKAKPQPHTDPDGAALEAKNLRDWREVHGRPAIWMAPLFLIFALAYGLPLAAQFLAAEAPRPWLEGWAGRLPAAAAEPVGPMLAGWLWAPWWVALPALLMRLRATWTAGQAVLDAVGWGMGALAIEGLAWLWVGRKTLAGGGFTPLEQEGAWRLLAAEFVFLLLTAILFGPTRRYRAVYPQG